ncbi:biotin-dependent carboxyltransferase family protein [Chitinibacter sp. S2-10]|uniref:5-oxoprolinase subunit C family protein n=1 Tax=Chitinibacter sp. S2-10 TaxID=3373597 RepID=UPI003977D946
MKRLASLEIIQPGIQTTVQDLGRMQGAELGLPQGGAADPLALRLANLLLGNPGDAAALEITLGGFRARFLSASHFALAGADCLAQLDGRQLLPNAVYAARAGQLLQLFAPVAGTRSYLALPGGIAVPKLLGSRSTLLSARLGGLDGRALLKGDRLAAYGSQHRHALHAVAMPERGQVLRFIAGPQWDNLGKHGQQRLQDQAFKVDIQSNRMALKLRSDKLQLKIPIEMASHAVFCGTVQLPPDGQPMILLSDAQVTGGYPVIAQIIQADLWRIGQFHAGETLYLQAVNPDQALSALQIQQDWLQWLAREFARE